MFKIGDSVIHKPDILNKYGITSKDMIEGKVVDFNKNGFICIKIMDHKLKNEIGGKYWVDPQYFMKMPLRAEVLLEDNGCLEENAETCATTAEMILIADKNNKTYDLEYSLCSYNKELGFFDRELLIPWAKTYSKEKLNEFFHKGKWIERKEEK